MLFCKTPAFATVFLLKGFLLYLEGFRRFRTENSGVAQKLKKAHVQNSHIGIPMHGVIEMFFFRTYADLIEFP